MQRTAFAGVANARAISLKRYGYLAFLLVPALPPSGWWLGHVTGLPDLFSFWTPFVVFAVVPAVDWIIGTDTANPAPDAMAALERDAWYRWLPMLALPVCGALLLWGAFALAGGTYGTVGRIGHVVSIGACMGIVGITAAHELIHKSGRLDQRIGGVLLTLVCYGSFKVEHIRGHHVTVSTPEDRSSARFGQSVYHFLPRAYLGNVLAAWHLEARRLRQAGAPLLGLRNEVLRLTLASGLLAVAFYVGFGWLGLAYFVAQSLVAVTELEIVNYIEHYGLHRRRLPDGRWERVTLRHSWNAPFLLTNLFLFQLQRHSDHHARARRRYSALLHHDESPQLPAGYGALILLALVPPLWFRVMNPRVRAYYRDAPDALAAPGA